MKREERWGFIREVINQGGYLDLDTASYELRIAGLGDESDMICLFDCDGMKFDAIMDHLDELAKRYLEEGIVSDEFNGQVYSIW